MKTRNLLSRSLSIGLLPVLMFLSNISSAQVDTTQLAQPDTAVIQTTQLVAPADTVAQEKAKKEKSERKRKDEFIPYAGVNFNHFTAQEGFESATGLGYHLGFNYKRGKFFYWQAGARFNNAVYDFTDYAGSSDFVSIKNIDLELTGGINFLSFVNRLLALRIFVSAVPSYAIGVGDNDLDIEKDDINAFILYGQAGLGINVAFLVIETGYNYGFQDQLKDNKSKPGQIFINLGFRF